MEEGEGRPHIWCEADTACEAREVCETDTACEAREGRADRMDGDGRARKSPALEGRTARVESLCPEHQHLPVRTPHLHRSIQFSI